MTATPFADASDVRARWSSLPSAQDAVTDQLCADASLIVRAQYPGIDDQIPNESDLADRLEVVVVNMVKRAIMIATPGAAQESSATGPYSHSVTYANPLQNLFVTAAEDSLIRGYLPRAMTVSYPDC